MSEWENAVKSPETGLWHFYNERGEEVDVEWWQVENAERRYYRAYLSGYAPGEPMARDERVTIEDEAYPPGILDDKNVNNSQKDGIYDSELDFDGLIESEEMVNNSQNVGIQNGQTRDYHSYKQRSKESGRRMSDWLILSGPADPFFAEQPAQKKWAEWFTDLYEKRGWGSRVHTIRGLHYALRTNPEPMPSGDMYDYQKPSHVQDLYDAVKYARTLGLVDDAMIVEEQNEPSVYVPERERLMIGVNDHLLFNSIKIPDVPLPPNFFLSGYEPDQRYHLEIWCEKNTMNHVLMRLATRYNAVLQTCRGQPSLSMIRNLIERVQQYGKPAIILYINDFDPSGMAMPVVVARHIEHYLYARKLDLHINVDQIVLTPEQVQEYNLPINILDDDPNKKGEPGRNMSFKQRYGVDGSTELDALEELRPGELRRVIERAILKYYDDELESQVYVAKEELEDYLRERVTWVTRWQKSARDFIHKERDTLAEDMKERIDTLEKHLKFQWLLERKQLESVKPCF